MVSNTKYWSVKCGYCGDKAVVVNGLVLYGADHKLTKKFFYYCEPCKAWVGMHENSNKPFGTLANAALRKKRLDTHKALDFFWVNAKNPSHERKQTYSWLASKMKIPVGDCHIGMFDLDQCATALRFCLIRKKECR